MVSIIAITQLLLAFQLKHFLCDFPFQGKYMLGKFQGGTAWILPLLAHAGVHALGTLCVVWAFLPHQPLLALKMAACDLAIHSFVDRLKAAPNLGGRFPISTPTYWHILGLDQMAHHITHYAIILNVLGTFG